MEILKYKVGHIVNMKVDKTRVFEIIGTKGNNYMLFFPEAVDYVLRGMDGIIFKTVTEDEIESTIYLTLRSLPLLWARKY